MKKKSTIAILAVTAALVVLFAACSRNNTDDGPTNPTVVGADGQIYEEVTELHSELVTEVVSEIVSEVVTDDGGKAVTNNQGQTEVKTEVKTEVVSKVVTTVVTVTKPYVAPTTTQRGDTTAATSDSTQGSTAGSDESASSGGESSNEDVTFPEGTVIEVVTTPQGQPAQPKLESLMSASKENRQFYLNCRIVTNESDFTGLSDVPYKVYVKGSNIALEVSFATLRMKIISKGSDVSVVFPAAKTYYTAASSEASLGDINTDIWDSLTAGSMDYIQTTNVRINGRNLTCEEYSDGTNTNKYYFNGNDLYRIEVIANDGTVTILKVTECSSTVSDSVFDIPSNYSKISQEALESYLGGLLS